MNEEIQEQILSQLRDISLRLSIIEKQLDHIKLSNDNMNDHIDFVESVYDTVKSPFYYILSKVKRIPALPEKEVKLITKE